MTVGIIIQNRRSIKTIGAQLRQINTRPTTRVGDPAHYGRPTAPRWTDCHHCRNTGRLRVWDAYEGLAVETCSCCFGMGRLRANTRTGRQPAALVY
jgi:hypothetical protein